MKKRTFDVLVISLAAVAWVPVVLVSAVAVLLLSGRPIFYRSSRWVGPSSVINMVKLRVMVPNASRMVESPEAGRFLNTPPDSPLYTGVGRVLDRLGLNEIPQFVHVLRGQMTIVGARPLTDVVRTSLLETHATVDERWASAPAGLTGLPQLVGRMGLTDAQRLHLESAYSRRIAERYSVLIDFKILLLTVLITFGLRQPLSFEEALEVALPQRRRQRVAELASPAYTAPDIDAVA